MNKDLTQEFEKDGERFMPHTTDFREAQLNLQRYMFALAYCNKNVVLDAGCGAGLGTYIYSLTAEKVYAVDYKETAFKYAKLFPIDERKVHFLQADLEKDVLPEVDTVVALEVIEHLANPDFFLSQLRCKTLIFSVPVPSLPVSSWHKYDFQTPDDVKELIGRYFKIESFEKQDRYWYLGRATKL